MDIKVTISETDEKILKNDIIDAHEWVNSAVSEKIENCWARFRTHWVAVLMDDPAFTDVIPASRNDFVELVMSRPDYKDRAAREA